MRAAGRLVGVLAAAAIAAVPASAQSPPAQQVSVDALTDVLGQHETAVEPDSFSFGNTVVAAFQVGRSRTAGASAIGWSTSRDGGASWSSGVLPSLTIHASPPGSYTRATDPAVAYDRAHGTWLISVLALQDGPSGTTDDLLSALVTSRSLDGLSWSAPVVTSSTQSHFAHDKNWIVCDNGDTSPFRGRCYVVWTAVSGNLAVLGISSSTDGGANWTPATLVTSVAGSGWQPLVRPDGTLVIIFAARALQATRSIDGGRSFSDPVVVSSIQDSAIPGWRAPAFPSAELDARGRITVAWPDCRFRSGCGRQTTPTDVVFSSSPDGVHWSRVRRVPTGPDLDGLPHFVVGLGVDTSTSGSQARLGLAFHVLTPRGCSSACFVAPYFVSSSEDGEGWTAPEQLASPQEVTSFPQAGSERFLGDYISTSFATGGIAVPLSASATRPYDGHYHQGIFAAAIPPRSSMPVLRAGKVVVRPRRPRAHTRVDTSVVVAGLTRGLQLTCRSANGRLQLLERRVTASRVTCRWRLRDTRRGERLTGTIGLRTPEADVSRRFAFRAGRA